jgi:hypothetical protein
MCSGGRLVADFTVGTEQAPDVPEVVRAALTPTADGRWVVWARKLARPAPDGYQPLSGGVTYPADAVAQCRRSPEHHPPMPYCTCGFHALLAPTAGRAPASGGDLLAAMAPFGFGRPMGLGRAVLAPGVVALEVALSGRVVAQEWRSGGVLFRAARQTVVRVLDDPGDPAQPEPDDPGGVLARVVAPLPRGQGPRRLALPSTTPPAFDVDDDAGLCRAVAVPHVESVAYQPALCLAGR